MKAIKLSFTKKTLMAISRELYLDHGWRLPRGLMTSQKRNPLNFTLAQWRQAKRIGKDPREIKAAFQDCWAISDSQAGFKQALKERGYTLAKGDRRGFVALDHRCEVFAVSKWVGIKTKEVRKKLTAPDALPTVTQAREQIARDISPATSRNTKTCAMETRSRLNSTVRRKDSAVNPPAAGNQINQGDYHHEETHRPQYPACQ